jgi:microcystin-dependent protein
MQSRSDQHRLILGTATNVARVSTSSANALPIVGELRSFVKDASFGGWLLCDGSEVSRAEYPQLYELFTDKFGIASTTDTFILPNCTSRVVIAGPIGTTSTITATAGADHTLETISLGGVFVYAA